MEVGSLILQIQYVPRSSQQVRRYIAVVYAFWGIVVFCFSIGADVSVCTNSTESTNCVFINCLIGVVVLLIALSLGIFLSCLLSHLYHQRKLKVTTGTCKPFHAYDEVILKTPGPMTVTMINNEAYAVHAN